MKAANLKWLVSAILLVALIGGCDRSTNSQMPEVPADFDRVVNGQESKSDILTDYFTVYEQALLYDQEISGKTKGWSLLVGFPTKLNKGQELSLAATGNYWGYLAVYQKKGSSFGKPLAAVWIKRTGSTFSATLTYKAKSAGEFVVTVGSPFTTDYSFTLKASRSAGPCSSHDDCQDGKYCQDGKCSALGYCSTSSECYDQPLITPACIGSFACIDNQCNYSCTPAKCKVGDKTYSAGESFPSEDGCNTCSCSPLGTVACTEKACFKCTQDSDCGSSDLFCDKTKGQCRQVGSCSTDSDCYGQPIIHPMCVGGFSCVDNKCNYKCDGAKCAVGDKIYSAGDNWPAPDGCNTCSCSPMGTVGCTELGCVCEPKESDVSASELSASKKWTGKGSYEIEFAFGNDGTFTRTDLVSPCPADVMCFWSGIVTNSGKYTVSGSTVTLTYDGTPNTNAGVKLPATLTAKTDCDNQRILVETTSDGTFITYRAQ